MKEPAIPARGASTRAPLPSAGRASEPLPVHVERHPLPRHRIANLPIMAPRPKSGGSAAPIQLMPGWKRKALTAAKWTAGAAAGAGALLLGGAALGVGGLAAGAAAMGAGLLTGGLLGAWGAHSAQAGRDVAEDRMKRWVARDEKRKARARFPTGQYDHDVGIVGISGLNKQRISQTNQNNWNGNSLGKMPDYADVKANLNYPGAHRAIYDPHFRPPPGVSDTQGIATVLAASLTNVSEADKIPGIPKFIRGAARRYDADPILEHPFDPKINPAAGKKGAQPSRDFMAGNSGLTASQRDAIDGYASDSSAESDDYFPTRTGMLRKRK
jgi:hypothetical protein